MAPQNDDRYAMHDLRKDMDYLKGKVSRMDITLHGPEDTHEPSGLKVEVGHNSRFRINVTKLLWIVCSALCGILAYLITGGGI